MLNCKPRLTSPPPPPRKGETKRAPPASFSRADAVKKKKIKGLPIVVPHYRLRLRIRKALHFKLIYTVCERVVVVVVFFSFLFEVKQREFHGLFLSPTPEVSLGAPSRRSLGRCRHPSAAGGGGGGQTDADTKGETVRQSIKLFYLLLICCTNLPPAFAEFVYSQTAIGCEGLTRGTKAVIGFLITVNP